MNMPATRDVTNVSSTNLIMQSDSFDRVMRLADLMASGKATVPEHLQKNPADCAAIIMQSMQWNMNPFAVAQKTFTISGKLGYEAQLVNAVITSIAPTKDRLNFEWFGDWEKIIGKFEERTSQTKKDDSGQSKKYKVPAWKAADEAGLGVKVWATLKREDRPRELVLMLSQALTRNSTMWVEDPRQQLAYLGIKRWSRLYCPDVILGVYTPDELEEISQEREINPPPTPQAPTTLPAMDDEKFKTNFPSYEKGIASGRKTHDQVITTIQSKFTLSAEQENAIRSVPAPIDGQAEEVQS
jgi:hypothetical protein